MTGGRDASRFRIPIATEMPDRSRSQIAIDGEQPSSYREVMEREEPVESIKSFPGLSTPVGSLMFGGQLYRTTGTGFTSYRTYGMFALVLLLGNCAGRYRDCLGTDRRVAAGDLIVVFPDVPHQYGPEAGDTWHEVFVSFGGAAFDGWRSLGLDPTRPVWTASGSEDWPKRFFDLLELPAGNRREACIAANAIHLLISDLLSVRPSEGTTHDWLENACRALGGGRGSPSPQEIARDAGLGYETFRKNFKAAMGESPSRYRKRMRLTQAELMLQRADLPLEMIAAALDFCDAFHFSKAFKQHHGISPSQYRRERCGGNETSVGSYRVPEIVRNGGRPSGKR